MGLDAQITLLEFEQAGYVYDNNTRQFYIPAPALRVIKPPRMKSKLSIIQGDF